MSERVNGGVSQRVSMQVKIVLSGIDKNIDNTKTLEGYWTWKDLKWWFVSPHHICQPGQSLGPDRPSPAPLVSSMTCAASTAICTSPTCCHQLCLRPQTSSASVKPGSRGRVTRERIGRAGQSQEGKVRQGKGKGKARQRKGKARPTVQHGMPVL